MKRNMTAVIATVLLGVGSAAIAAELTTKTTDPGLVGGGPGGLDSGDEPWGYYEVSASQPVSGLVRIGAHHARRWNPNPANPSVQFDISEFDVDWDIAEMGLEIKAAYVPGYSIGVRFCVRSGGNTGPDGADDGLEVTGAYTNPETQLATYDPSSGGGCKTVNVLHPVEAGATEYTLMVRPVLQMAQETYWQYTIYGKVTVEYYPVLGSR